MVWVRSGAALGLWGPAPLPLRPPASPSAGAWEQGSPSRALPPQIWSCAGARVPSGAARDSLLPGGLVQAVGEPWWLGPCLSRRECSS